MKPPVQLGNVYLISGGYDRETGVLEKSAFPIQHAFFTRPNHQDHTLIETDEHGKLGSVSNDGEALKRINHQIGQPLRLNPIPPGLARLSYFVHDKDWQNKLIEQIRELDPPTAMEPIAVTFSAKHCGRPAIPTRREYTSTSPSGAPCPATSSRVSTSWRCSSTGSSSRTRPRP